MGDSPQQVWRNAVGGHSSSPQSAAWLNSHLPAFQLDLDLPDLPSAFAAYDCRNNRALLAVYRQIEQPIQAAIHQYGAERLALVIGTSTSGNDRGEHAVSHWRSHAALPAGFSYSQQELGGAAQFLAQFAGIRGPAYSIATSCSSSANALAAARRLLQTGWVDAVVVGGCDTLCDTTLQGFACLGALSQSRCNPFSRNRDGTVLGEGAALFLMTREPGPIALCGVGATSDAYHISTPRPEGDSALHAMQQALLDAGIAADAVDYLNLHGTGTLQNDAMESGIVHALFGDTLACSSTKSLTGHCLGAAGAIEAALCWLALSSLNGEHQLPRHCWDGLADPELPSLGWVTMEKTVSKRLQYCLSNSFAFGGSNVSLLFGRGTT